MKFQPEDWVGLDLETGSYVDKAYPLQPFRLLHKQAHIRSIALTWWDGKQLRSKAWYNPSVTTLSKILKSISHLKVLTWNGSFDVAWFIAEGLEEEVNAIQWVDGMLLWRHLFIEPEPENRKKKSYSLKAAVCEVYPEHCGYEDGIDFNTETEEGIADLLLYNRMDTTFTYKLSRGYWLQLNEAQRRVALIEAGCIPLVAGTAIEGIHIDVNAALKLGVKLEQDAEAAFAKLLESEPDITPEVLASPKQLAELLYQRWGLPVMKLTDSGADSTDKEALHELAFIDERARTVRAYREAKNNKTKFVDSTLASVEYNGDDCTRPNARIFGTYTGRMTYSSKQGRGKDEVPTGVALHQWKRDPLFREMIVPPEGYDLCEFDFAGQEFGWMAVESGDEQMLALREPGEDAHTYMGYNIWVQEAPEVAEMFDYPAMMGQVHDGIKAAKAHRQLGKVANLSLQYRTSAPKLRSVARVQHNIPMTPEQAQLIRATYLNTFKGVPNYWARQIAFGRQHGYIENLAGRRVQLRGDWTGRDAWGLESTAINYPIQSIGAEQKYLALLVLRDYLPQVGGRFYFELHDGLFVLLPKHRSRQEALRIKAMLSNLPYKKAWGFEPPISFPVDAKVGPSWGALVELN